MAASLSQSSVNTYRRPWILFQDFAQSHLRLDQVRFPVDSDTLALFVAYLYEKSYSPTTVLTYLSAIGYVHRLAGWPDPSKSDRVQLILRDYSKIRPASTKAVKLSFSHYKHSDPSRPVDLIVYREEPVCPVPRLIEYLALRGCSSGPLFCWPDNTPVSREYFVRSLKEALQFCDLDHTRYKSHSFRIGAASWAAANGMSDAQIRLFGRWKSNAFLRYIRPPTIGSLVFEQSFQRYMQGLYLLSSYIVIHLYEVYAGAIPLL